MANRVTVEQWIKFELAHRDNGGNVTAACRVAGISRSSGMRAVRERNKIDGDLYFPEYRQAINTMKALYPKGVIADDSLTPEAAHALTDFAYFRKRYFGRVAMPWATHTANLVADLLDSPHKEFVVCNEPPGVGKSTFWTIDLPAWLICRNRAVRIMLGSASQSTAAQYSQQLRRELERDHPVLAPDELKKKGLAFDAESTLVEDFGNFKPPRGEPWTAEQFVVTQDDAAAKRNKEPTVSAFGMDSRFLGNRCDLIVWDDLVDAKTLNSAEKREQVEKWWEQYAETRLEPGGLLVLQGQRLHAEDLYHHVINIDINDYGTDDDAFSEPIGTRKMYRHIKYKAHYDETCDGDHHPRTAAPYDPDNPDESGCLLDPKRLLFRDLMAIRDKDNRLYQVSYQQEDIDPAHVLVSPAWIAGGRDAETGENYPGCWDNERVMGVIPQGLTRPLLSVVTADPSPSKFWSVQWWAYHVPTEQRFLIDHYRGKLQADGFLDFYSATGQFGGLLEEWWQRSKAQGAAISNVVVEQNAAQQFLLQYEHVKNWQRLRGVRLHGHNTTNNKTDAQYGVQALLPQQYRYGRVRLPSGDQLSRGRSMALVGEVTRYPESSTTDCVMAHWFLEYNLRNLIREADRTDEPPVFKHRVVSQQALAAYGRR